MKKVLYRPSWQKLRVSCLAQNHPQGGFNTDAGTQDNLNRLANYLDDATLVDSMAEAPQYVQQECLRMDFTIQEEAACRIWRVLNLLNAVRMGFHGTNKVGTGADQAIVAFRAGIQPLHQGGLVVTAERRWSWEVVQTELEELWVMERYWFTKIYQDLGRRKKVATRRRGQAGQDDIDQTRPELLRFVGLMEEINRHAS